MNNSMILSKCASEDKEKCIATWSGDDTLERIIIKMIEELSELGKDILLRKKNSEVLDELADVYNVLKRTCYLCSAEYSNIVSSRSIVGSNQDIHICRRIFELINSYSEILILGYMGPCKMKKYDLKKSSDVVVKKSEMIGVTLDFTLGLLEYVCAARDIPHKDVYRRAEEKLY